MKSCCEDCGLNDSVHNVYFTGMLDTPVPLCKHCRKQLDEASNGTNSDRSEKSNSQSIRHVGK